MKRIVNGKTYNTDTSILIGHCEYEDDAVASVYQSHNGLFYIVRAWEEVARTGRPVHKHLFEPTNRAVIEQMISR